MPRAPVSHHLRRFAKSMRRDATDAEQKMWMLLRDRRFSGVKFRRQVPIGSFILDFVSFEHRLVIEVDGGQHADSSADQSRDAELTRRGLKTIRYWNNDVLENPDGVLTDLLIRLGLLEGDPSPGALRAPPSPTRGEGLERVARASQIDITKFSNSRSRSRGAIAPELCAFFRAPQTRGAERRETRERAKLPEWRAKPLGTLARRAASSCDRGSAPLGAPPRHFSAPDRAS